jgi:alpha-glucosidase
MPVPPVSTRPWWREAVVYQVYLRSFSDSDGDGVGDLGGLRARLDHLVELGVDGLWINPCYPSPQTDHGYDVADYTDIDPIYGDLAAFDALLAEAHDRGLRLLMDLVPNHCSSRHPWFRAALEAPPGSRERARFLFRDGRGPAREEPPNDWDSVFGGSAWTRITEPDGRPGQWYLHLFDAGQPDFDWRNPEVADMFDDVLRFWFDRGVDGFRIDVAHGLVKAVGLPERSIGGGFEPRWDQPEVHDVYRRWRRISDSYSAADGRPGRQLTFVGEVWVRDPEQFALYVRQDELQQAFYFDLLVQPWRADAVRASVDRGLGHMARSGATITWALANHDVHRTVTRYGQDQGSVVVSPDDPAASTRRRAPVDLEQGAAFARAAALFVLALPGSAYLYQGDELGLPEVMDMPDTARVDPVFARSDGQHLGRDGCRVPLPWQRDAASFGFSPTPGARAPWLPQPDWFRGYALDGQQSDPRSTYTLSRRALQLRSRLWVVGAELAWLDVPGRPDVLAFSRGAATCVAICGPQDLELPREWGEPALASAEPLDRILPGRAAAWLVTD